MVFLIMMPRVMYIWQENLYYAFREKRLISTKLQGVTSLNNRNIIVVGILSVTDIHR
jgi:hypothetical protein